MVSLEDKLDSYEHQINLIYINSLTLPGDAVQHEEIIVKPDPRHESPLVKILEGFQ